MFVQIEAQTIINEWVRIVPAQLKFLGPTTLIQFNVKNWTILEIGDGVGVEVSWQLAKTFEGYSDLPTTRKQFS